MRPTIGLALLVAGILSLGSASRFASQVLHDGGWLLIGAGLALLVLPFRSKAG